ncbi:camp-binding protein [Leptolyngbya sp. Heron Island J]|uniref:Crp/Fnr family transcriptional regulator n=1 Tax=Leptolyngbya sp. Heron Island J TaxID=1385935 RepID=UPI0003B9F675|nr:Crp/Fnr family transcriptional regulator [Leptolyngbya sp. Heron Island J]ESA35765.1 camp-binding protein [Leptolyngbya sp. Heron Island J]
MHQFASTPAPVTQPVVYQFKRREIIPLQKNTLWHFQTGAARLLTLSEEGAAITLGFWGAGDFAGQPLIGIQPCELECLMDVEAFRLHYEQCRELPQVTMDHLHQMQALIRMRQGNIPQRLQLLLTWLGQKFGCPTEGGQLIQLRLTHQELAETVGTTRVTVTRLMQDLEQQGSLYCSRRQQIILRQPPGSAAEIVSYPTA